MLARLNGWTFWLPLISRVQQKDCMNLRWRKQKRTAQRSRGLGELTGDFMMAQHGLGFHTRSFTDFSVAPFLKATGDAALEMSPPSIVMPSFAAPSTCRKTFPSFKTRVALNKTSCDSMKRRTDSASLSPCTLKPFTAASVT